MPIALQKLSCTAIFLRVDRDTLVSTVVALARYTVLDVLQRCSMKGQEQDTTTERGRLLQACDVQGSCACVRPGCPARKIGEWSRYQDTF